jgi:hypothetical protein
VPAGLRKSKRTLVNKHDQGPLPTIELSKIRNTVNQVSKEAKAPENAVIVSVTQNIPGNIILTTRTDRPATTILQYGSIIDKALSLTTSRSSSIQSHHTWAKIMVHGISQDTFPDNNSGLELLQEELTQSNADRKLAASPRYLTCPESRVGKSASTIVLAFHNEAEAKAHCSGGIIIDGLKKKTDRFWQARATDQ